MQTSTFSYFTNYSFFLGLYASGWIATGPIGVLLSTMQSAFTTAEIIVSDINSKEILGAQKEGKKQIIQILAQKSKNYIV